MKLNDKKIAVIGMACRYPGANNIKEYWNNLLEGKDTIKRFTDEELSPFEFRFDEVKNNPDFVRARGILDNVDKFDAEFFGMTPRDAALTDPQHRVWLETAWEAFENAGCDPVNYPGSIGVFAGGCLNSYLLNNILRDPAKLENYIRLRLSDSFQTMTSNDVSYIPTKTAYHFNLKGPAINVQTTCSTSLVAISQACQSLYNLNSDICLAGAVCILVPQETGYVYQEGAIHSPDGFCRPFDAQGNGTVFSNGVGVVVLKRLDDAIRDRDTIYAVVDGWAINNDGSNKISYTAPSIDGQAEVVMMAQSFAEISPEEISYIETHGTGTQLGDPIEVAGLKKAFSANTNKKQFCGIGSVKSNIGHTDVASGVASFIKACLIAYHKKIPATLHYSEANPHIDFEDSPFFIQKELQEWTDDKQLIIGVSSFGIGGTNAHVIIEEPPVRQKAKKSSGKFPELIVLSGKTEDSLVRRKFDLIDFLNTNSGIDIHDVAYTLGSGRNHMHHRGFFVASDTDEVISADSIFRTGKTDNLISEIAFMFPGQGSQYISMGKELYNSNLLFRLILDECFSIVKSASGEGLKKLLFESPDNEDTGKILANTAITQPVLFIIEYALAKVFEQLDIKPRYLIGHSIGEYTAACIAGVFDMRTALLIVIKRGQLMQRMQPGKMMAVMTSIDKLKSLGNSCFEIAADNAPSLCTISFKSENSDKVQALLDDNDIQYVPLNTSHAFHSESCEPILSEFREFVDTFKLNVPILPFISCLTGEFITNEQATSGNYWAKQLRNPVLFRQGISTISKNEDVIFLEIGPNTHLSSLVRQNNDVENKKAIITTLGKPDNIHDQHKILSALGNMFVIGRNINFQLLQKDLKPCKVSLPDYPFEKKRHWIDFELPRVTGIKSNSIVQPKESNHINGQSIVAVTKSLEIEPVENNTGIILNIWKSLTGISEIGLDENFFELGGQSLLALQITTRIKEELNFTISLKSFYDNPTINKLSSIIKNDQDIQITHSEFIPTTKLTNLTLSASQKGIWIHSHFNVINPAYNIPFTYHLTGKLNIEVFNKAINILFNRHPVVFSVFGQKDGNPYFDIIPKPVTVNLIDYSNLNPEIGKEKIYSFAGEDTRKVFDIESGPLFRLYLLKRNDSDFYFHATIHHLIFDGWSWNIFVHDFRKIYDSLIYNRDANLEPIDFQYYDYSIWQESYDNKINEEISKKFWIENLKDCSTKLNFPYDHPRKETPTGFGAKEYIKITPAHSSFLRELSKKANTTLFPTLLSSLGILLQKYSGENDICLGTAITNRPQTKLEKIFGLFINTTIIRLKIGENTRFGNLINSTRNAVIEAISHKELSFEKLVETVKTERALNINPFFQVSMVWLNELAIPMDLDGIKGERVTLNTGVSPFDITFYLWDNGDFIEGEIEYNIDILERETIIRLKDNFIKLLQSIIEDPDQLISDINIISDNEKKILDEINSTDVPVPDFLAHDYFEMQVLKNPLKTAVISGNKSLTYNELNDQSNQLARHLHSLNVKPGEVVGICLERSLEMVISILGVLKAGGCYLPLDPTFPDERVCTMLEDSGAETLITNSSLKDKFRIITKTSFVVFDSDRDKIRNYSPLKPDININSQSLAYIIYTSGSTGKPKGVKIRHHSLVNLIQSLSKTPGVHKNDTLLAIGSPSFDISVSEIFLPISNGATLVLASTQDINDGISINNLIEKHEVSLIFGTPSFWGILIANDWKGKENLKGICGGEALTSNLVRQILTKVREFYNYYGPTETTVVSTGMRITDPDAKILIGKALDNTKIYILDKFNHMLPIGVTGEVAIGGVGVATGYLNRPELTAEKFIQFDDNQVIYKTGDLGRLLKDGNVELFGRIDHQIKLRGFRIEPGEIETLLSRLSGVIEAVVKIHKFDEKDERLVAFLNVDAGFNLTDEAIRDSLTRNLPAYMIPSFFMKSDGFPRTLNGKTDKKALVYKTDDSDRQQEEITAALTETQKGLIDVWKEILKVKYIKVTDNFFDIGGNSLLAVRVINSFKEKFGFILTFKTLIENQTIAKLSVIIENQRKTVVKAMELVHLTDIKNLPLSSNQQRIWMISKLHPEIPSYIIPISYQLKGAIDKEKFQKSLNILFHRHHILFSVIKDLNGQPYFEIIPREVNLEYLDYSTESINERESKISDFIDSDAIKLFDLTNGPLYRLYLIDAGNREYYFHMCIHHVIFDGWSWQVLVNDLNQIYNSLLTGEELNLKEIEFQQYDYANWERKSANFNSDNRLIDFWRENLKDISPVLNFPLDYHRPIQNSGNGIRESIKLSPDLSEKIRRISKAEGSSLFGTMLSAFATLIQKYSGEDDFCIGTPVAYRPHSKLENIIGMFVNTIVIRLKLGKDFTFKNLMHLTNETLLNVLDHQDLPFEKVVDIVKPDRDTNINPIFQVCFAWQNNLNVPLNLKGIQGNRISGRSGTSVFDMALYMWENEDIIEGEFEFNADLFKRDTIIRVKANFLALIQNLSEHLDIALNAIPLITDEESKKVIGFTDTLVPYPNDKTIIHLFEEQVRINPRKVAVIFKKDSLTYKQLDEKSNQLARTLKQSGVRENIPVGIIAERSLDFIVGILGILKAGGGYVPIDPEYPEQRINFIINNSGCRILLTQEKYISFGTGELTKINLNSSVSYTRDKSAIEGLNSSTDLAYIMYTSGTTGVPKGSMILHKGVVRMVRNMNYMKLTPEDRILLTGAIVFDASTFEIWGALLNGASLFLVEKETILNPRALGAELKKNDISILWLTAPLLTQIAESRTDIFSNLKYLLSGGDVLSAAHINKVRKDNPKLKVLNCYGPTENTTFSTAFLIEKDYENNIPIGKPISNSTTYIFDKNMNYQPIGVIGELYVGGDGLSRGYLNRDDLNKKSFIDNPQKPGERLYKTGDYARWLPDGNIEFHGRIDNQLKLRGFRVELGEIEAVISELDGVIETVIKPIRANSEELRLIAFLNVSATFSMNTNEIIMRIKEKLPSYMIPSTFKTMQGFPKTINGKINKDALTLDVTDLTKRENQDLKTLTQSEKKIFDIWSDVLKTRDILTSDNFFEIGGNSLLAISVMSKIESAFDVELGLRVFFDSPRIKDLAEAVDIIKNKQGEAKSFSLLKDSKLQIVTGEI